MPAMGKMAANSEMTAAVTSTGGIPAGASSIVINTTATQGTAPSYLTVYPAGDGRVRGVFTLPLSLPPAPRAETTTLQLRAPGAKRSVTVHPGESVVVRFRVAHRGPWTLRFRTNRPGYLGDGRPISVMAQMPTFAGRYCGTLTPTA